MIFAPCSPKTRGPDTGHRNLSPRGECGEERLQGGLGCDVLDKHGRVLANHIRMSILLLTLVSLCLTFIAPQMAGAQSSERLNARQTVEALQGKTLIGEYPDGAQWSETFNADNSTLYREGNFQVIGQMEERDTVVCFSYPSEQNLTGGCFEVWRRSENCFDFYGTEYATSMKTSASETQKTMSIAWSARGWFANMPSTCVEVLSS